MEKIHIGTQSFLYPMPVVLVGTVVNGRPNFMTVGWISRVNFKPPLLGMGISKGHYTAKGILENKAFSVNIPSASMAEITDYCGIVSGKKQDKSWLFDLFYGEVKTAPMIRECPLTMECRLDQTVELPSNYLFIGEIAGVYTEEQYITDGCPDIEKMNPLSLTMPDNRYWKTGECAGSAWKMGKNWKKREE